MPPTQITSPAQIVPSHVQTTPYESSPPFQTAPEETSGNSPNIFFPPSPNAFQPASPTSPPDTFYYGSPVTTPNIINSFENSR